MDITRDFIDASFRTYVQRTFCDGRDSIRTQDVEQVEELHLSRQGFTSLRGLEHFAGLRVLDCAYNELNELDIRRHVRLEELECSGNRLLALHTGGNPALKRLFCQSNTIVALDLSANAALESLDCGFNRLRKLDVSRNGTLAYLTCHWNLLSELALGNNPVLRELNCGYNALFALELDRHALLEKLDCGSNHLVSLDLSGCRSLTALRCNGNHLTRLDLEDCTALESLRCFQNHLSELRLQHPELTELYCSDNKLAALDTSGCPKLTSVSAGNNLIREPDCSIDGVGTFVYDLAQADYSAELIWEGTELYARASVSTEAAIAQLAPIIREAWDSLGTMRDQALSLIAAAHPDEDVAELTLSELNFAEEGTVRLGFDAGDTPAGRLYIYAVFGPRLELERELEYETY